MNKPWKCENPESITHAHQIALDMIDRLQAEQRRLFEENGRIKEALRQMKKLQTARDAAAPNKKGEGE